MGQDDKPSDTIEHQFRTASFADGFSHSPVDSATGISGDGHLYHSLHHGTFITLLEIDPGASGDPIICYFHYVDLLASPLKSYEALSHVWGTTAWAGVNNIRNVPVQCNSHELGIATNLEQAIKHIRSKFAPIFLWADAICINQEDQESVSIKPL
jgi:hypothetical protein